MYKAVLFDLDGTLTDPKPGITRCVQYALHKLGIEEPDLDKLTPFIGPPLLASFQEFYGLDEKTAQQAIVYYRERFSQTGMYENAVYPGIAELLETLRQQGKELFVATSKPTVFSEKILEHFGLKQYFTAIVGSELDGSRVEKDEVIGYILREYAPAPLQEIIMVGDRKFDILGARHHGLAAVAVSYGYGSQAELEAAQPLAIADDLEALSKLLLAAEGSL